MISHDIKVYEKDNIYEFDNNIMLHYYPKRIKEILGDKRGSCLDLGLGHGYVAEAFSEFFDRYVVLDGDINMIKRFKKYFPENNIEIIETYFEDYSTEEKFDVILCGFVLEHVESPQFILKRYANFLKREGRMFIAVPNAETLNRRIGIVAGILEDLKQLSENDILLAYSMEVSVICSNGNPLNGRPVEITVGIPW